MNDSDSGEQVIAKLIKNPLTAVMLKQLTDSAYFKNTLGTLLQKLKLSFMMG